MNMWPGAWKIASDGLAPMTTAWGVTPHAQNTGTSPRCDRHRVAEVGRAQIGDAERGGIADVDRPAVHHREAAR